ncbi:hypothetical protein MMC11_007907 [Xylographa trunciseda]|nr:hypothetical protein [Xylographa trunciseda]
MAPKIAIIYYSMYGHISQLAKAEQKGIEAAGGTADLYQYACHPHSALIVFRSDMLNIVPRNSWTVEKLMVIACRVEETLPSEVLTKMHAPGQDKSIPFITPAKLEGLWKKLSDEAIEYDGFLMGIPTRYGNFPAQFKAFWDHTGQQWQTGAYYGKYCGVFVSTASVGGGQESTVISAMSTLTHHGIIYVPIGYKHAFSILANLTEVRGGSPWGAGTFAVGLLNILQDTLDYITDELFLLYRVVMAAVSQQNGGAAAGGTKVEPPAQSETPNGATTGTTNGTTGAQAGDAKTTTPATSSAPQQSTPTTTEKEKQGPCGLPEKSSKPLMQYPTTPLPNPPRSPTAFSPSSPSARKTHPSNTSHPSPSSPAMPSALPAKDRTPRSTSLPDCWFLPVGQAVLDARGGGGERIVALVSGREGGREREGVGNGAVMVGEGQWRGMEWEMLGEC